MSVLNDSIVIISLVLCVPLIGVYIETLLMWSELARHSFTKAGKKNPGERLARGIFVGFSADLLDNLYWFITWTLVLMEIDLGLTMMLGGSAANVVFRQSLGLWAGYEHVLSAHAQHNRPYARGVLDVYYWIAAAVLAGLLIHFNDWSKVT